MLAVGSSALTLNPSPYVVYTRVRCVCVYARSRSSRVYLDTHFDRKGRAFKVFKPRKKIEGESNVCLVILLKAT